MRSRVQGRRRLVLYFTTAVIPITFVPVMIVYITWCLPISWNWSPDVILEKGGKRCSPNVAFTVQMLVGIANICTDLLILLLGVLILRALRLTRVDNFAFAFVVCIGLMSVIATIARMITLNITGALNINAAVSPVGLTVQHTLEFVSCFEVVAAMLAFSLPSFRFLLGSAYLKSWWTRITTWKRSSTAPIRFIDEPSELQNRNPEHPSGLLNTKLSTETAMMDKNSRPSVESPSHIFYPQVQDDREVLILNTSIRNT